MEAGQHPASGGKGKLVCQVPRLCRKAASRADRAQGYRGTAWPSAKAVAPRCAAKPWHRTLALATLPLLGLGPTARLCNSF